MMVMRAILVIATLLASVQTAGTWPAHGNSCTAGTNYLLGFAGCSDHLLTGGSDRLTAN